MKPFVTNSVPHGEVLSSHVHAALTDSCNMRFGIPTCCADCPKTFFPAAGACCLTTHNDTMKHKCCLAYPEVCKHHSAAQSIQQSRHSRCSYTVGCAVLSFDPYQLPAIQPVPLLLATPADLDSPLDSTIPELGESYDTGFKGAGYLMVHAGQLWSIQYK